MFQRGDEVWGLRLHRDNPSFKGPRIVGYGVVSSLCHRGTGTGMSEATVLVTIFPDAAEGGVRPVPIFDRGTLSQTGAKP